MSINKLALELAHYDQITWQHKARLATDIALILLSISSIAVISDLLFTSQVNPALGFLTLALMGITGICSADLLLFIIGRKTPIVLYFLTSFNLWFNNQSEWPLSKLTADQLNEYQQLMTDMYNLKQALDADYPQTARELEVALNSVDDSIGAAKTKLAAATMVLKKTLPELNAKREPIAWQMFTKPKLLPEKNNQLVIEIDNSERLPLNPVFT